MTKTKDINDKKLHKRLIIYALTAFAAILGAGLLYIIISGSEAPLLLALLCAAVLCLLPSAALKMLSVRWKLDKKRRLLAICYAALALSIYPMLCFYISFDYQISVYRYMKKTAADVYYFGGYENFRNDYSGTHDFMVQMKSASASLVLESLGSDKLEGLSDEEIEQINNESLWDYFGYDDFLGTTEAEVESSMKASRKMNAYDFTFDYRGFKAKNTAYLFRRPRLLKQEIADIAKKGSHTSKPITLAVFLIGQGFCLYMIGRRFEITDDKRIVICR